MIERFDNTFVGPNQNKIKRLGFISIISAVAAIPLLFISVHRVYALQKAEVCLARETTLYRTVDAIGSVLPFISVIFGVLSLIRFIRNKTRFTSAIPALAGIALAAAVFSAYFLALTALAENRLY
ncbi:MAG: hypothetical protein JW749_02255 [Sedimentisphaerales bacterium]|nr:hypothetical protein [Sedimentisphaerales bacterium]